MKIADTWLKRTLGLMFRSSGAMLFTFEDERRRYFWSPFMFFDVNLFFFNSKKQLVEKTKLKRWSAYQSKKSSQYVLECEEGSISPSKARSLLLKHSDFRRARQ